MPLYHFIYRVIVLITLLLPFRLMGATAYSLDSIDVVNPFADKNIRIVINSKSTGGDTYQNATIIAQALSKKLHTHVKVDAIGTISAFQELSKVSDGTTLMISHDQAYLGYLYGRNGYVDIFEQFQIGPTIAVNPGNAYLVAKSSRFQSLDDIMQACFLGSRIRVAIQAGGASELGFSALKNAIAIKFPGAQHNLVPIYTGAQAEKNQLLFDQQVDLISGTLQANSQYTQLPSDDQKSMRFLWLTSSKEMLKQLPLSAIPLVKQASLIEPELPISTKLNHSFTFDKEFFFLYNKAMEQELVDYLDQALIDIFNDESIKKAQLTASFVPNFQPSTSAHNYLRVKNSQYQQMIAQVKAAAKESSSTSLTIDFEHSHLFFPTLMSWLLVLLILLVTCTYGRSISTSLLNCIQGNNHTWQTMHKRSFFGTIFITLSYFILLGQLSEVMPNTGFAFLISSMLFLWSLAWLFSGKKSAKVYVNMTVNAIVTPFIVWFVLAELFQISLP